MKSKIAVVFAEQPRFSVTRAINFCFHINSLYSFLHNAFITFIYCFLLRYIFVLPHVVLLYVSKVSRSKSILKTIKCAQFYFPKTVLDVSVSSSDSKNLT